MHPTARSPFHLSILVLITHISNRDKATVFRYRWEGDVEDPSDHPGGRGQGRQEQAPAVHHQGSSAIHLTAL